MIGMGDGPCVHGVTFMRDCPRCAQARERRGGDPGAEIVRIRDHGPAFVLRDNWTVEAVRQSAATHERNKLAADAGHRGHGIPWRCRRGKHQDVVIGDVYTGERDPDDVGSMVVLMVASMDTLALKRCERCGRIAEARR